MTKLSVIISSLLVGAATSSANLQAQTSATNRPDVAQLLYQVDRNLIRQEGVITTTHEAVLTAHDQYTENPNPSTYAGLLSAAQKDQAAVEKYTQLVNQAKAVQAQIQNAEQTFYEETPATKTEIETGPVGKDTPSEGESVAVEIPEPPAVILEDLKQEIKESGGEKSSFAEQLRQQKDKLQSLQDRIKTEEETGAVTTNPEAKKQDNDLVNILSKAIEARRKALGED